MCEEMRKQKLFFLAFFFLLHRAHKRVPSEREGKEKLFVRIRYESQNGKKSMIS